MTRFFFKSGVSSLCAREPAKRRNKKQGQNKKRTYPQVCCQGMCMCGNCGNDVLCVLQCCVMLPWEEGEHSAGTICFNVNRPCVCKAYCKTNIHHCTIFIKVHLAFDFFRDVKLRTDNGRFFPLSVTLCGLHCMYVMTVQNFSLINNLCEFLTHSDHTWSLFLYLYFAKKKSQTWKRTTTWPTEWMTLGSFVNT